MSFALGTLAIGGKPAAAMRLDGAFWPIERAARAAGIPRLANSLMDLFADWDAAFARLRRLASAIGRGKVPRRLAIPEGEAALQTPLQFPRKCFCVGANYQDHLDEMGASGIRKVPGVPPFFFLKPPSTTLVGPGRTVYLPHGCDNFDWEVEFVVVFGKGGRHIRERDALAHVAGYSVGVDFTSRNQMFAPESFFKFNFTLGKCQDTMSPLGPVFVPATFLPDPMDVHIALAVNGVPKQSTSTRHMIYSIAEQIAGVSQAIAIEPGDVMFTGSPAGVGYPRGEKLAAGDRVRFEAEHVGAMEVVIQPPFRTTGRR